jgi:hypothetical protein
VADYAGARRAAPALTDAVAEPDDAALSCPECGALVRADQEWCTLCLHVLHQPKPAPVPEPEPAQSPAASVPQPTAAPAPQPTATGLSPEVEAAADALIAQLAAETHRESLKVPPFLRSKAQRTVAIVVAGSVLTTLVVAALDLLGAAFH